MAPTTPAPVRLPAREEPFELPSVADVGKRYQRFARGSVAAYAGLAPAEVQALSAQPGALPGQTRLEERIEVLLAEGVVAPFSSANKMLKRCKQRRDQYQNELQTALLQLDLLMARPGVAQRFSLNLKRIAKRLEAEVLPGVSRVIQLEERQRLTSMIAELQSLATESSPAPFLRTFALQQEIASEVNFAEIQLNHLENSKQLYWFLNDEMKEMSTAIFAEFRPSAAARFAEVLMRFEHLRDAASDLEAHTFETEAMRAAQIGDNISKLIEPMLAAGFTYGAVLALGMTAAPWAAAVGGAAGLARLVAGIVASRVAAETPGRVIGTSLYKALNEPKHYPAWHGGDRG